MKEFLSLLRPFGLKVKFALLVIFLGLHASTWAQLPTAQQVASQIKVGWNIGNTLEAPTGETSWGNPMVSQQLINSVKAAGFNAVRIPVAWDSHQTNGVIHASWLARIKEVVDYCVSNNMYAVLNIHWDGGWLEEHPLYSYQTSVNAKQRNYWTQIANYFKNYNEHLLFAGTNEVHADYGTPTTEHINVQQSYLQTFIDAVRATGGNNSTRTLVVQTYNTNAWHGINYFWLPSDPTAGRLIVEIHDYDPFDFTQSQTGSCLYWGSPYPSQSACSWAQEAYFDDLFSKVKAEWVDKGIPVIMGEYGVIMRSSLSGTQRTTHIASREYYINYVTKAAYQRGIKSFYWDIGTLNNGTGLFNRSTGAVTDQGTINAIMQAVGGTGGGGGTTTWTMFKNRGTGLQIDGMSRTTNGSNVSQWATSGSGGQQWLIENVGSYVKLKNRATGLYLDGMGRTANGSVCGQYSSSSSNNQQWTIETVGSYVKLRNRGTGLYVDGMGRTTNGSDLGQYASGSSYNQQWSMSSVAGRVSQDDIGYEHETKDHISLSPNPFTSELKVTVDEPAEVHSILMMDLTGKQVEIIEHEHVKTEQQMGLQLKPGLYLLQINGNRTKRSFKVIKK
jgi:endoglucanase